MLSVLTSAQNTHDNSVDGHETSPGLRILFIVESMEAIVSLRPDRLSYSCICVDDAIRSVEEQLPGAILVWSQVSGKHSSDLNRLRDLARVNAIPFLYYSPEYTVADRKNAMKYGVDDYVWGPLPPTFEDKIAAIRKIKEYNRTRKAGTTFDRYRFRPGREVIPAKRAMDIFLSLVALLLLSPVLLVVALIIKVESRGPIFYISKRAGNGYRVFDFYKFRSMRQDADQQLQALAAQNQYGDSAFFKIKNDPRITRFGSFLRTTSIDELPQLINVLKGDMSLVGNRPLPLYEAEKLTRDGIAYRFLAPAGITGLWQITKRGKEEMSEEERIRLDMIYARKYSFLYDLKILVGTLPALLQKEKV
jgi:lipopolysaccharide/colanic/teichoic acid biosynthesis glycosyltransferase